MNTAPESIRMVFEMTREEHPRLYDDLIRFSKGTKRINRLRTLAHDGLLLQSGMLAQLGVESSEADPDMGTGRTGARTSQIFDEPLSE